MDLRVGESQHFGSPLFQRGAYAKHVRCIIGVATEALAIACIGSLTALDVGVCVAGIGKM